MGTLYYVLLTRLLYAKFHLLVCGLWSLLQDFLFAGFFICFYNGVMCAYMYVIDPDWMFKVGHVFHVYDIALYMPYIIGFIYFVCLHAFIRHLIGNYLQALHSPSLIKYKLV